MPTLRFDVICVDCGVALTTIWNTNGEIAQLKVLPCPVCMANEREAGRNEEREKQHARSST